MKRLAVAASLLALLSVLMATAASADDAPYWIKSYPERTQPPCLFMVAEWSDGSYTNTPIVCDQGFVTWYGTKLLGSYPEVDKDGCVWQVSRWMLGDYSKVPVSCPAGVKAYRPVNDSVFFQAGRPTWVPSFD